MSGPKCRINFKILPLHYDADAWYGEIFQCDHKLKLNKNNSHLLKPVRNLKLLSFLDLLGWTEFCSVTEFFQDTNKEKSTLYCQIKKIPLQFSHFYFFFLHKGCKREQVKLKLSFQARSPSSFLCSILRGNRAVTEFSHNTWSKLIMIPGGWNQLQHLQTWASLQPSRLN